MLVQLPANDATLCGHSYVVQLEACLQACIPSELHILVACSTLQLVAFSWNASIFTGSKVPANTKPCLRHDPACTPDLS